jgi:hypothetical protein
MRHIAAALLVACSASDPPVNVSEHDAGSGGASAGTGGNAATDAMVVAPDATGDSEQPDATAPEASAPDAGQPDAALDAAIDAEPPQPEQCPGPEWDPYGPDYWTLLELEPGACVETERTFSGNLVQYTHSLPDGSCYSVAVSHMRVEAGAAPLAVYVHFHGSIAETDRRIIACM